MTATHDPAPWAARAGALMVDVLPGVAVLAATALVALSVPLRGLWWWVCAAMGAAAILWTAVNRLLLPAVRGQSVGRAALGITVVHRGGGAVDPWALLLRDLAHLLDTAPMFIGWLWPLRDPGQRTFADLLVGTQSRCIREQGADRRPRRAAAAAMLTAAAFCGVAAVISYTVVRQQDRSITEISAQISAQGPQLVVQLLSYRPETIQGDFDRARSLATDNYREQLGAMQRAAVKAGPQRNEYWVTDSSVLSAAPGRASMLVFLQGRRGAPPDQRYLATSVRVTFIRSDAAGWRIDDVSVVADSQTLGAKS